MPLVHQRMPMLALLTLRQGLRRGWPRRAWMRQIDFIGTGTLLLVAGGMAFFGAVMMAHGAYQARKVVGDLSLVGPPYFQLMLRMFGPTVGGLLAAVRIGAAISAELAAMKVTEQVDALELSAGDRYSDLVLPRVLGGLVAIPCLIIAGTITAVVAASLVATYAYGADGRAFMDPSLLVRGDISAYVIKSVANGIIVPLAACRSGLAAEGGAGAVGEATTDGVVAAAMSVLAVDIVVSFVFLNLGL